MAKQTESTTRGGARILKLIDPRTVLLVGLLSYSVEEVLKYKLSSQVLVFCAGVGRALFD